MRYFAAEFEDHIVRGTCPAGVCQPIRVASVSASHESRMPLRPRSRPLDDRHAPARRADAPDAIAERLLDDPEPAATAGHARPSPSRSTAGTLTGREGQTILEVCRDNGIEVPTLCYEPKLPGFGACRMCVVEVEGEDDAAHQLLARRRAGHGRAAPRRRACARSARPTWS